MCLVADDEIELDFLYVVEAADKHLVGDDHDGQQRPLGELNRSVLLHRIKLDRFYLLLLCRVH